MRAAPEAVTGVQGTRAVQTAYMGNASRSACPCRRGKPVIMPDRLLTRKGCLLKLDRFRSRAKWWRTAQSRHNGSGTVDIELLSEQVRIERKLFSFDLRENPRGRFLKITEDVGGRRDTIIIPATGLDQVREVIGRMIDANQNADPGDGDGSV